MKRKNNSSNETGNFEILVSKLGKESILDLKEMSHIRGGDGGGDPIIVPPPPGGN